MDASRTHSVLVVEPDGRVAQAVAARLEDCRVDWVPSLRAARSHLRESGADVLVLDATTEPESLEFFQAIRFAPEGPRGGAVVLTDPADHRAAELARQLGAARVMARPVRIGELRETILDLLRCLDED